jgi:HemY protein
MRKIFIVSLVALLIGVGLVALIETDPGYILISHGNYTLETSLWVGLLLLLVFTALVYGMVRLARKLVAGQHSLVNWLGTRKSRQAARLTTRGLINFIEGNWTRARSQLLRGARHNDTPMINYLMAARASYRLNEPDKMREYLGAAEDAESEAGIAVELTQAELKLHSGQYEQALATLVRARRNAGRHPYVLELLHRACIGLNDWENLVDMLPELRKYQVLGEEEIARLERQAHSELLRSSAGADVPVDKLHEAWGIMPVQLRQDPTMAHIYVDELMALEDKEDAEGVILQSLKQNWDAGLVRRYGLLESDDPARQLSRAEGWLSDHADDAELLLCLGRLASRDRLWGKSRDYFESSYRLQRRPETCAELGRLLVALGEPKVAAAYFREGLMTSEADLPELPMPENLLPQPRRAAN